MTALKIVSIIGARPQFIKYAPLSMAVQQHNESVPQESKAVDDILIHTGQHYDYLMSKVFFDELAIPDPRHHLDVGSASHGMQTGEMLKNIEQTLVEEKPDLTVVFGDTNSTLAGALAAAKLNIPVAHVEAGLRSYNRKMPEEINRVLTDHVSALLFCPTSASVLNLSQEGITDGVFLVGDIMYDIFLYKMKIAEEQSGILDQLGLEAKTYTLATLHRAENTEQENFTRIIKALSAIAGDGQTVVFPAHPRTKALLERLDSPLAATLKIIEPVPYFDMLLLEKEAQAIITDSGGVQKEAYFHHVPCLTVRNETEWTETVEAGWNYLCGTDTEKIVGTWKSLPDSQPVQDRHLYGDGKAAEKILDILLDTFANAYN